MITIDRVSPLLHDLSAAPGPTHFGYAARVETPLLAELRRALDHDELALHYQPIIEPVTGEILGAEALVRWQHPERGLLGPGEFLDVLEHSALVPRFTDWVVDHAIEACARWPASWFVSINLSPRELLLGAKRDLRGRIARRCREHGVAPDRVWLEVTEQGLVDDSRLVGLLTDLAELGVHLAVDDFGDGNASLGRLRALPVDIAKLDRSLLGDVLDPATSLVLRLNLELAQACGSRVVAEGVETAEQLAFLRDHGCEMAQGFHLARPLPAEQLLTLAGSVLGDPVSSSHHLALYDDEAEACEQLTDHVAPALHGQGSVVVVARTGRLRALTNQLSAQGLRVEVLRQQGRLLDLDAEQLLDALLYEGAPDATMIRTVVTEVFNVLAVGAGPVRVYSELGALLWQRGQADAAFGLEAIWDGLEDLPPRVMLCAFPTSTLADFGCSQGFRDLRACHDRTSPSRGLLDRAAGTSLAESALLQQELEMIHREGAEALS